MIGRAAYHHPWQFRNADSLFFGAGRDGGRSRREAVERYLDYAEKMILLHKVRVLPSSLPPSLLPSFLPASPISTAKIARESCFPHNLPSLPPSFPPSRISTTADVHLACLSSLSLTFLQENQGERSSDADSARDRQAGRR